MGVFDSFKELVTQKPVGLKKPDFYNLDSRRHLTRNKCKTRQIKVWTVF